MALSAPATVRCINHECDGGLQPDWEVCAHCGLQQRPVEPADVAGLGIARGSTEYTLRPGDVVDESSYYLSHLDAVPDLRTEDLYLAVAAIIEANELPLELDFTAVRWEADAGEARDRVVIRLRDHLFSTLRVVAGIDYLGNWAMVQLMLVDTPEFLPAAGAMPKPAPGPVHWLSRIAGLGLLLVAAFQESLGLTGRAGALAAGALLLWLTYPMEWRYQRAKEAADAAFGELADHARQRARLKQLRQMRDERTFKTDDARLFCVTMTQVLRETIDRMFIERGARLEKEKAGTGGYFGL